MGWLSKFVTDVETDVQKAVDWVKSVDWNAVAKYWQEFVQGLEAALPVIEKLFPGSVSAVEGVVTPVVKDANTAVTALVGAVQSYANGTITEGSVLQAAQTVQQAVQAANNVVGAALQNHVAAQQQASPGASTATPASKATGNANPGIVPPLSASGGAS
jgi:hypothetical protein